MLSASLSQSRKFARLDNNNHRLMFVMLIPHVDEAGRHDAEPAILAGKCYTTLGFTPDEIRIGLGDMSNVGLICLYEAHGDMFLEIVDFHTYQTIRRKDNGEPVREAPSKIPPPCRRSTDTLLPQSSDSTAAEVPQSSDSSATLSAAQSKAMQSNRVGAPAPTPTTENQALRSPRRARPEGRPRPAAIDDYLNRRADREKTPVELAAERLVPKVEA
jgi:hypothetical protein